ncbi:MAG: Dam family site-specific DNA-(adenine-N6)-methyltransferase [Candidatus Yanofskybacteria bacterium]|nr:Dam family site-specific DNA-(adenine-N6)-methyltransferase [Candidatus Yanofskybacteria bacterium]
MKDAGFGNISIGQRRYLGSKTKLLPLIRDILGKERVKYASFADIFAGTGVVADHFHNEADIVVNDILESNYLAFLAFFGNGKLRASLLTDLIVGYNNLGKIGHNYFSKNFANTYFDLENSKRIGYIREDIESLYRASKINERERAYLVTSLMYALDRIANTVGHYDAYRKVKIVQKRLELKPLEIKNRKTKAKIFKMDANALVKKIRADVVYIDPPYNSRQYSDAYHLLENIAEWKKEKVYGVAKKINRDHIKSRYSLKSAGSAFSELINDIDAKFILVSYNDMGTSGDARSQSRISDHEILSALERKGSVKIYDQPFNQFTTGRSSKDNLKERVFFCAVSQKKSIAPIKIDMPTNTHLPDYVKSPLNYTGGKHKLLPQLFNLFPKKIGTFYDMFCGGANVGINAAAEKIVCIDNNPKVIEILNLIQKTNFEELNQTLVEIVKKYGLSQSFIYGYDRYKCESSGGLGMFNKESFLRLRAVYNSDESEFQIYYLLVLVLYSFNNQIRFNSQGKFNLPVGKRDYNGSSRRNLANFNALASRKNISFLSGDFREIDKINFRKEDFIYLDPPYLLGLASYNEMGGWSEKDEIDLHSTLTKLDKRGVRFALSNVLEHKGRKNDLLAKWAKENNFKVHRIDHDYRNSNYQTSAKNSDTKEVLVTNYI